MGKNKKKGKKQHNKQALREHQPVFQVVLGQSLHGKENFSAFHRKKDPITAGAYCRNCRKEALQVGCS